MQLIKLGARIQFDLTGEITAEPVEGLQSGWAQSDNFLNRNLIVLFPLYGLRYIVTCFMKMYYHRIISKYT